MSDRKKYKARFDVQFAYCSHGVCLMTSSLSTGSSI